MGIKGLSKVIQEYAPEAIQTRAFTDYTSKRVVVDISQIIYQFVIAIRNSGDDLKNKDGVSTSHIHAVVSKMILYAVNGIFPICAFDGKPPALKDDVIKKRGEIKKNAKDKLEKGDLDEDERIKMLKRSFSITQEQINECKEILEVMGIPVVQAPEESDSQCACLTKSGIAYGVASDDMDLLTFGTPILLRNFGSTTKKIQEYNLQVVCEKMRLTNESFIDLCILLGCDYANTIPSVGQKRAVFAILKYGSIENFVQNNMDIMDKFYLFVVMKYSSLINYLGLEYMKHIGVNTDDVMDTFVKHPKLKEDFLKKYLTNELKVKEVDLLLSYPDKFIDKNKHLRQMFYENYLNDVKNAREYFKASPALCYNSSDIKWKKFDEEKLKKLLLNKYGYSIVKVRNIVDSLKKFYDKYLK